MLCDISNVVELQIFAEIEPFVHRRFAMLRLVRMVVLAAARASTAWASAVCPAVACPVVACPVVACPVVVCSNIVCPALACFYYLW